MCSQLGRQVLQHCRQIGPGGSQTPCSLRCQPALGSGWQSSGAWLLSSSTGNKHPGCSQAQCSIISFPQAAFDPTIAALMMLPAQPEPGISPPKVELGCPVTCRGNTAADIQLPGRGARQHLPHLERVLAPRLISLDGHLWRRKFLLAVSHTLIH